MAINPFHSINRINSIDNNVSDQDYIALLNQFDLLKYLSTVLNSKHLLNQIAERSYSHDNGFYKLVLFENNTCKLRLHFWKGLNNGLTENIHNHRWNIYSRILFGNLNYSNFIICDSLNPKEYFEYEYLPNTNEGRYNLVFKGKKKLHIVESKMHYSNDTVILDYSVIHRVTSLSDFSATIFLSGPVVRKSTQIFSEVLLKRKSYNYKKMSVSEIAIIIKDFLRVYKLNG